MADENVPAYVGVCVTCLGINAAMVDDGSDPKGIARFVGNVTRKGHAVERKTVGFVRTEAYDKWCTCHRTSQRDRSKQMEAAL